MDKTFCRYCGKQIDEDATFCTHCGKEQSVTEGISEHTINCPQCGAKIAVDEKLQTTSTKQGKPKLKKFQKLMIALCCFMLLCAIAWVVAWGVYETTQHDWFYNREVETIAPGIIFSAFGLLLSTLCYVLLVRHSFQRFKSFFRAVTLICFGMYIVTFLICCGFEIAACVSFNHFYTDFKYNSVLAKSQKDSPLYNEALALVIERFHPEYRYQSQKDLSLIREASEEGNVKAQEKLAAYYYELGNNVIEEDKEKAYDYYDRCVYWFLKAAEQGSPSAQCNVGRFYMGYLRSRQYDIAKAAEYLIKAAKQNFPHAFYYLGVLYKKFDEKTAYNYWKRGAELGDEDCKEIIERPQN